ncbi:MAG: hypothetical protein PHP11_03805 [Erysipelotrichaceae bacterium]|nr:hypothetical protein [Erysipelotrichaceae bacterium]MDD3924208.1 hypothetical protein [Erysipelotrichaceae bacterium]MDD4642048.1 hypothetical protein [Erysipelotrichaceae bacterium]
MRKLSLILLVAIFALSGCSTDPYAEISANEEAVISVDDKEYTRGQFYEALVSTNATALVTNKLIDMIYQEEIGDDSEIIAEVNDVIDQLKASDESYFNLYLSYMGYTSEEAYINDMMLFSKQDALVGKYIEDNYDSMIEEYQPKMVRMLQSSDKEAANTALELIKDGADFKEMVATYGNDNYTGEPQLIHNASTNVSGNALLAIQSYDSAQILDAVVVNVEGTLFNVIEIVDVDPISIKEDFIATLKQDDTIISEAITSFVRAGNFTVYDKNVYEALLESNPDFLDQ